MTYAREPVTFEATLDLIVDRLGLPAVLQTVGKARRTVGHWSNPHCDVATPIDAALALDCAWRASGGAGAPMLDTYRRLFEASAPIVVGIDMASLPDLTVTCIQEVAEAKAALFIAALPNATPHQIREAKREVTEGIAAMEATLMPLLAQQPP